MEPKLISPLLDGFIMGEPISDHHGVRCCPALREDTDERYMVKIVSIPASQDQLDALLLTGAFKNELVALDYFQDLTQDTIKEASVLSQLSKLAGFLPFQASQVVKMDDGVGYDIYFLSPYRRSLARQMIQEPLTHLSAINLGLDMCAALAECRRIGYLYVDLKPENIFLTDTRGYCIGDLGVIGLSSLKYASLPERYRSRYTPPEVNDAYASLDQTMDLYALGLVMYQLYNNCQLPPDDHPADQPLPPPMYADYELAEIILKACAPDPQDRWADPGQMGQALVDYMQRNGVNDTPIIPPPIDPILEPEEEPEEFLTEEENDRELAQLLSQIGDEEPPEEMPPESAEPEEPPQPPAEEGDPSQSPDLPEEAPVGDEPAPEEEAPEAEPEGTTAPEESPEEVPAGAEGTEEAEDAAPEEKPLYPRTELTEEGVTTEVAQILAQAEELMQVEAPEPVVVPGPIDVPIPPPIVPASPQEDLPSEDQAPTEDGSAPEQQTDGPAEEAQDDPPPASPEGTAPGAVRKKRPWIGLLIAAAAIAVAIFCGSWYYHNHYLQTIDALHLQADHTSITVQVDTKTDSALLTVTCTDTYGNTFSAQVVDGRATFTELAPSTHYTVRVTIQGDHKLQGITSDSCTTLPQIQVLDFTASVGPEDGSVVLLFTADVPTATDWLVEYSADGQEPQTVQVTGNHTTITGLTVGQEYTFRLISADGTHVTGSDELRFTPQKVVLAQDLEVQSYQDGKLTLVWETPEGADPESWTVRIYNDAGDDRTITTEAPEAVFEDLDEATGYTLVVTAQGMTQSAQTTVTAHPINVTHLTMERLSPWSLGLTWTYTGQAPADGWLVEYTIDGGDPIWLACSEEQATIVLSPGCAYAFRICPQGEITFFSEEVNYGPVQTDTFSGFYVTAADMLLSLHQTPAKDNWAAADLDADAPVTQFTAGSSAALLIQLNATYPVSDEPLATTVVIRDSSNALIQEIAQERPWRQVWYRHRAAIALDQLPAVPGEYVLDLYMNGMYVSSVQFTIV